MYRPAVRRKRLSSISFRRCRFAQLSPTPPQPPGWWNPASTRSTCFLANGGLVLFGTDVGFTNVYDTSLEFELMHRALSEREVLASPTTKPASYFKAAKKGRAEKV